jgi:anti-anti-sigma factor
MSSPPLSDVVLVQRVTGELDLHTRHAFERTVRDRLTQGSVILDLVDLQFLAIAALPSLLVVREYAATGGRQLVLARPPVHVRRLLEVAQLDGSLDLCDSVDGAVDTVMSGATLHLVGSELPARRCRTSA